MNTKLTVKTLQVKNCCECPHVRTEKTPGAGGLAIDYYCGATSPSKKIAGYIESPREGPLDYQFPSFCPLESAEKVPQTLEDLPENSVVQDPYAPDIFWTKDSYDVWVPSPKRSAGLLHQLLGNKQPEVLFVPTTKKRVWPPKKDDGDEK